LIQTQTIAADLEPLKNCPWWLFTSVAAVRAVLELGGLLAGRKLGAVGVATAGAIQQGGGEVSLSSPEASASSLAHAFIALGETGPVGLPQGNQALPMLSDSLREAGYSVRPVVVYQTQSLPWPKAIPTPDITLIASPSAVEGLSEIFAGKTRFVALGATTAQSLQARGWNFVLPREPSAKGLLQAIEQLAGEPR
jgi:uroporphyrinogen-III synthase